MVGPGRARPDRTAQYDNFPLADVELTRSYDFAHNKHSSAIEIYIPISYLYNFEKIIGFSGKN